MSFMYWSFFMLYIAVTTSALSQGELKSRTNSHLAGSFFQSYLDKTGDVQVKLDIEGENDVIVERGQDCDKLVRLQNQMYLYINNSLHLIGQETGSGRTIPVVPGLGSQDIVFVETHERDGIFLFLACSDSQKYCQVYASSSLENGFVFVHDIETTTSTKQAKFFVKDNDLYLLLITDQCLLYKWMDTYFDLLKILAVNKPTSSALFHDDDNTIIVISQNWGQQDFSMVYSMQGKSIKKLHWLPSNRALDVFHYSVLVEKVKQNFVVIVNENDDGHVYWWDGRQLVFFNRIPDIVGRYQIQGYQLEQWTVLMFYSKNQVKFYRPTPTSIDFIKEIHFDQNVLSIGINVYNTTSPSMNVLTKTNDHFIVKTFALKFTPLPQTGESILSYQDRLLGCYNDVTLAIRDRNQLLDRVKESRLRNLGSVKTSPQALIKAKTLKLKNSRVNTMKANTKESTLTKTLLELNQLITKIRQELYDKEIKLDEINFKNKNTILRVVGDLYVDTINASRVTTSKLNDRVINWENVLSYSKNQKIETKYLPTLMTNKLQTQILNKLSPEEMVVSNAAVQRVKGKLAFKNLKSNNVVMNYVSQINGVAVRDLPPTGNISGFKILQGLLVKNLEVKNINNIPFETWMEDILNKLNGMKRSGNIIYNSLDLDNLNVVNINGIPVTDFLQDLITLHSNRVHGQVRINSNVRVNHLSTRHINGMLLDNWLTTNTAQIIQTNLDILSLRVQQLNITSLNNKPVSALVDTDSSRVINGLTVFKDMTVTSTFKRPTGNNDKKIFIYSKENVTIYGDMSAHELNFSPDRLYVGNSQRFDPTKILENYWLTNDVQVVPSSVKFTKQLTTMSNLQVNNINRIQPNSLLTTSHNNITADILFSYINVNGKLCHDLTTSITLDLNHLRLYSVKKSGQFYVQGSKIFANSLQVKDVTARLVNDIIPEEEILKLSSAILSGSMKLSKLLVSRNVTTQSINVVQMNSINTNVLNNVLMLGNDSLFEHSRFSNLQVAQVQASTINSVLSPELRDLLTTSSYTDVSVRVEADIQVPMLNVNQINQHQWSTFFHRISAVKDEKLVLGSKTFLSSVVIRGNMTGLLNTYDLNEFKKTTLSRTLNQTLFGTYTFDRVQVPRLNGHQLNNILLDQLVHIDHDETINGNVNFNTLGVEGQLRSYRFMNNCDIKKVLRRNWNEVEAANLVEIEGDVWWKQSHPEFRNVSHLYLNAVTKSKPQEITGRTVLTKPTIVDSVDTKQDINNVDLEFITTDALFKNVPNQVIQQSLLWNGPIKSHFMNSSDNVEVDILNMVHVSQFNRSLVRANDNNLVRGKKTYLYGIEADHLLLESVNGVKVSDLVFWDDATTTIEPSVNIENIQTIHLTVAVVNGVNMKSLSDTRISKTKTQVLTGIHAYNNDVKFIGDSNTDTINDVSLDMVIFGKNESNEVIVTNNVNFFNHVNIPLHVKLNTIQNVNFDELVDETLMSNKNVIFVGNMVYEDGIETSSVNISRIINQRIFTQIVDQEKLYDPHRYKSLQRDNNMRYINSSLHKLQDVEKSQILNYISLDRSYEINMRQIFGGSIIRTYNGHQKMNVYGTDVSGGCNLPSDCLCPTQRTLDILNTGTVFQPESNVSYTRSYEKYYSDLNVNVKVLTNSVSYSNRCVLSEENFSWAEPTLLIWTSRPTEAIGKRTSIMEGFLQDVNFFRINDSVFVVLAFSFKRGNLNPYMTNTLVYQINPTTSTVELIQKIPGLATKAIHTFWTYSGLVLAIGSGYLPGSQLANSYIYRFDEVNNRFDLLRFITAEGVRSVISINVGVDSFVCFVSEKKGSVHVYKYDSKIDNFRNFQELNERYRAISVTAVESGNSDAYMCVATQDDEVHIYQYKYIEGFVKTSSITQPGLQLTLSGYIGDRSYLMLTTSNNVTFYNFSQI